MAVEELDKKENIVINFEKNQRNLVLLDAILSDTLSDKLMAIYRRLS